MKKFALVALLFFWGSVFHLRAQGLYLGGHGGFLKNMKIMDRGSELYPYYYDLPARTLLNSYTYGLNLGYKLHNGWSFETQLQLTNEGYKERLDLLYDFHQGLIAGTMLAEVDWYKNYYYARIPVLAHYNFLPAKSRFGVGLVAGPNVGFLIRQSSEYIGVNELGIEKASSLDMEDKRLKKVDIGAQLGVRGHAKLNNFISVFMDVTMYQGFRNILDESIPSYYHENIVNRHISTNVGFRIDLL